MPIKKLYTIRPFLGLAYESVAKSYAQVFFSDNKLFGSILLVVSFFDLWAGLSGLIAIVSSNLLANYLGFSKINIIKGLYGFNSLLVGLGIGLSFTPGFELIIIVIVASIFTLFITLLLEGVLAKYYLPFLSIPFLLGLWTVVLSSRDLTALGLSQRGIYTVNELYILGGHNMVEIYRCFDTLFIPRFVTTYFQALGAIFFQYNLPAGLLIAIGLLIYSRISFLLSLIGYTVAWFFYGFLGAELTYYGYAFIGFNYILTAIALGGHFLVPSKFTYLWVILLLPVVVLLSLSLSHLLLPYQLSIYSLPFNIVVILFLYILKLRVFPKAHLHEALLQLNNPERNLYFHHQAMQRFKWLEFFPVSLPFYGQWNVSQAHHDTITHKDEWAHAWDFIILDKDGKQFRGEGDLPEDYYCYQKAVIAPAYGVVVEIVDGIEDNIIGEMNLIHNWGNSIVIKHSEYLYSQISHLKSGSFKVKKGTHVNKGEKLALCGNSGRSPYPHLHFQLQASPFVGSKTTDYPIDHFILKQENGFVLQSYNKPEKEQTVSNIKQDELLKKAFNLIPGQIINFKFRKPGHKPLDLVWEVKTDSYNNTYIHCASGRSFAYFFNDGNLLLFKNFVGDRNSALFYFYQAVYNLPFGFYKGLVVNDSLSVSLMFNGALKFLQDLIAPFYLFLKSNYHMEFISVDNDISPEEIEIRSNVRRFIFNRKKKHTEFQVTIDREGVKQIQWTENFCLCRQ